MKYNLLQDDDNLIGTLAGHSTSVDSQDEVISLVKTILDDVKHRGDEAVLEKTLLYDKADLSPQQMIVTVDELESAECRLSVDEKTSLIEAIKNVALFHEKSIPENWSTHNSHNAEVGEKYFPLNRVGIYVPGGNVPLISTAIMTVTLAKVAKVKEIVVVTPPNSNGKIASEMLACLKLLGVSEIYKVGGAQAIACLAFGTKTIQSVDKIYGPGNAFVNEAKRQVFGTVGIDLLPGPSEIMVIADSTAKPSYVAAALLAQAEHGSGKEKLYLLFSDRDLFDKISAEIEIQINSLSHRDAIQKVLSDGFISIYLPRFERIAEVANYISPEHLELQVDENHIEFFTTNITTAGAFLIGHDTSTSLGDFVAGPSHVLPTGRSSRFSSGLRLVDFLRRTSFIKYNKKSAQSASNALSAFARMEKLDGHGRAHTIRL